MTKEEYNNLSKEDKKKVPFKELPSQVKIFAFIFFSVLLIIIISIFRSCADEDAVVVPNRIIVDTRNKEQITDSIKVAIIKQTKDIDSLSKINFKGYKVDYLEQYALKFDNYATMSRGVTSLNNKMLDSLIKIFNKKIIKLQQKQFPEIREAYIDISNTIMWENDIEVSSTGDNYTTINITGHIFAANKNKKDVFEKLQQTLINLRFKKICFRWYKDQDDFTYYQINSRKDSEINI